MGVYISGLKMPQDGRITLQIDSTGGVYVVDKFSLTSEKYEKSMVATEIQSHGRLIDADALRVLFADWYRVLDDTMREEVALRYIDDAPTVIGAEE